MSRKPEISFVCTSRNDDHGGDLMKRMQLFVRGLIDQCNKYQLAAELIMVEWNPPADKAPLHEVLPKPGKDAFLTTRYVTVPNEVHSSIPHSDKMPLFQMTAKNVGIRRAEADMVACTNVDLLFSDELMKELKKLEHREGCFYRCNRCDIPKEVDETRSTEELLQYSKSNILQRLGKHYQYPGIKETRGLLFKIPFAGQLLSIPSKFRKPSTEEKLWLLDTDACGDFTMMSKRDWFDIKGYVELGAYSIHIDSLALISAAAINKKQHIFSPKACTYHISHGSGWELQDPIGKLFFDIERPMIDWSSVYRAGLYLLQKQKILDHNPEDWGYLNHSFEEHKYPNE